MMKYTRVATTNPKQMKTRNLRQLHQNLANYQNASIVLCFFFVRLFELAGWNKAKPNSRLPAIISTSCYRNVKMNRRNATDEPT